MADTEAELATSLRQLAGTHNSPKAVLKAVLEKHPKAKKKDVSRAAFRVMIEQADSESAPAMQDIGLATRNLE